MSSQGISREGAVRLRDWIWIAAVVVVAIVLRGIKLNTGLWFDEIVTLVEFVRLPTFELMRTFSSLNNHILYSLEAKAAISVFGESAWALRLPAMVFGVGCVAALWWMARQVVGEWEANMSALLLAVSYHHIWFSQNARGYTELMFYSIVGTGLFIRGMNRPNWRVWISYAFVVAAAAYTHLSAGFFFAVHGLIYVVVVGRRYLRHRADPVNEKPADFRPLVAFAVAGVLILLLHAPLLPQVFRAMHSVSVTAKTDTTVAEWKNPLWTVLEVFRNLNTLGLLASIGLPAVLGFWAVGAWTLRRRQPLFIAILLTHIPLTLLILLVLSFRIWPRYFFIDLGFIFVCVVQGVFVVAAYLGNALPFLRRWSFNGETLGLLASSGAVICSLFLLPQNYRYPKQDFLGARNFVEGTRAPGDVIASVGLASYAYSKYYAPGWRVVDSWKQVEEIRTPSVHTWLVYTSTAHMAENFPDVVKGVSSDFDLVARFPGTLGDGTVFVYRSLTHSAAR